MENDFMRWFGLTIPIVQAPIGGAANTRLATEVGRAGGMGAMALTWTPTDVAAEQIATLKDAAVPFYVNFVLRFGTAAIESAALAQPPAITLSWGIDADAISFVKAHSVRVGVQVATPTGAAAAIACWRRLSDSAGDRSRWSRAIVDRVAQAARRCRRTSPARCRYLPPAELLAPATLLRVWHRVHKPS